MTQQVVDMMNAETYLTSLPEVETTRMPRGTLFVANRAIYQVIETGTGFAKARQWRRDERTDVALVPGSFLTKSLPLVKMGRILPVYRSRNELSKDGSVSGFLFPTETLAKDAAYLDVALIISGSAYVRNHRQEPAFAVTDGAHIYRLYYFARSEHGRDTLMVSNLVENPHCELRPHTEGPMYWHLLPSWQSAFPAARITQLSMPAVPIQSQQNRTRNIEADPADATIVSRKSLLDRPRALPEINPAEVTQITKPVQAEMPRKTEPLTESEPTKADTQETRPTTTTG